METVLALATLLGGLAAAWYFWDKYREVKTPSKAPASAGMRTRKHAPASPVVVRAQTRAFCVLMGEDEGATRSALHESRDVVVSALKESGARLVETPADTVLAEFGGAVDGVAAAIAARDALLVANQGAAPATRVHYRFGIDQGEIDQSQAGPAGLAVEGAAALALRAHTDGIQLSEAVRVQLPSDVALTTSPVEGLGHVLTAGGPQARAGPLQLETLDLPLPGRPSILLLPFKALDDTEGRASALAEGLRIDVQNALTKMSGVFLIGAGSANAMRGVPAAEAGRRTGVRHVLEGSVRQSGDRVRVGVELIDTANNAVIWSQRYDRLLAETFALQDEITEKIVTALDVRLSGGEQARIWRKCLIEPKAREHFYNGVQSFFRMNAESMASARACFERVAERVPDSPLGATWVALTLWFDVTRGWAPDPVVARDRAGEWAERAAAMPDADGQAQTVLGNVRLLQRRFDEALVIARQALTIRPGCSNANIFLANVLLHCGEPTTAIVHAKRAIRYMPVYPPWFAEILAASYRDAGLVDLAVIAAREALRIAPSAVHGRLILTSALVRSGWLADARRVVGEVRKLDPALTLTRYAQAQPFRDEGVVARIAADLRAAGLPDPSPVNA